MGRSTINDVARIAGVSKKTVSRVINRSPLLSPETRARVEEVIARLGYVPNPQARALALRRTFLLALVHDDVDEADIHPAQQGVLDAVCRGEYALAVHRIDRAHADSPGAQMRLFLERHRPSGVITMPSLSDEDDLFAACSAMDTPVVHLCHGPWRGDCANLASGDREATAEAVRALHAMGHRRIGMLCGREGSHTAQQRELGYLDALAELGLDRGPALVATGGASREECRAACELLLDVSPGPSAVIAASPALTAAILATAYRRGVAVPGGLSVVGYCARGDAAHMPPLSTIDVPLRQMARSAAEALAGGGLRDGGLRDGAQPPRFASRFAPRGTTAPPG